MSELAKDTSNESKPERQFPALRDLLKGISISRKLINLYGIDHPSCIHAIESLDKLIPDFIDSVDKPTCIFAKDALIINDHYYETSTESCSLYERLRARGVIAITFIGLPGTTQLRGFLAFLNTEPSEIKKQGGPATSLRAHGVTKIVATEAVYTNGSEEEEWAISAPYPSDDAASMDRAVAAVIDWLSRQEEEDEEDLPRLPIMDILSNPDMAAKLIREAVTKLHASRTEAKPGDIVSEVVQDLKDLTGDRDAWDRATPQVRKAISKLPPDMRKVETGLGKRKIDKSNPDALLVDVCDIELVVNDALDPETQTIPESGYLRSLIGAKSKGMLQGWKKELESAAVLHSSGRTYATLMAWEVWPAEHRRLVKALVALIPRAVAMNAYPVALEFVGLLLDETERDDNNIWRPTNIRSSLAELEPSMVTGMVDYALTKGTHKMKISAAVLIGIVPNSTVQLVHYLGRSGSDEFETALRSGLRAAGQAAIIPLGHALKGGIPVAISSVIALLVEIGTPSAINEISNAVKEMEEDLLIAAINMLSGIHTPQSADICVGLLNRRSVAVRMAALEALGCIADPATVTEITKIALRNSADEQSDERVAAINALGQIASAEALEVLDKLAAKKPLIGRSKFEPIRVAAEQAAMNCRDRVAMTMGMAA